MLKCYDMNLEKTIEHYHLNLANHEYIDNLVFSYKTINTRSILLEK